jgi:hypothetical protein
MRQRLWSRWLKTFAAEIALFAVSFAVPILLATLAYGATLTSKKLADMDNIDAFDVVRSVGCTKVVTEQLNYPRRAATIFTCRKNAGLPTTLSITFRMELTDRTKTSFTLSWIAPGTGMATPPDREIAERAARRVLEAVGVADAGPLVTEFLRDVPMTGETYSRDFESGTRKITVSRSACDASHDLECHYLTVGD